MTQLIVRAIDKDAPGSYVLRDRLLEAYAALRSASDPMASVAAYRQARDLILELATTDDGTPVKEALAQVTANQFDDLLPQLFSGETVPPARSGN